MTPSRTALLVLATGLLASPRPAAAEKAVVLVRHAEKSLEGGKDPDLVPEGRQRAEKLVSTLKAAGVTAILTSETKRATLTAEPLARALGVTPRIVPGGDPAGTVKEIDAAPADAVVLVVGHSNTLPEILGRLGVPGVKVGDDDYGNLFVVVRRDGKATLVTIRY